MTQLSNPPYTNVETRKELQEVAAELGREPIIGVDLEGDSLFHFREQVCLIQISTPRRNFIIDPLTLNDLSPLVPLFADPNVRKVLHGADYDIRSLHRDFGIEVCVLFDTQIAARFLGVRETGLASLVEKRFGVRLEKRYQKRDWSGRPLPPAMLSYAVQDTCYLIPLAQELEKELRNKGRLSWVKEECEILSRVRASPPGKAPHFLKFRGAGRLDRRGLGILEEILEYRIKVSSRRDLPPFKVLGNESIMEMVKQRPVTEEDLTQVQGMSRKQVLSMGRALVTRIRRVLALPEEALPLYPRKERRHAGARVSARAKALKVWRAKRAEGLELDPSLVCSNAQIKALSLAPPGNGEELQAVGCMRQWQKEVFGPEICAILKTLG